ncbi:tellurite resistance TerB family protein [Desertibaculum subflavum]|uniref:tellurite resistance TerB family protein n=1 Tax=Desertibaculum subflavum TaxID=2268458 RepID=UPI000E672B91
MSKPELSRPPAVIDPHAALIYVMVIVSAVDREMSDPEFKAIGNVVKTLPIFRDFDQDRLVPIAQDCTALLQPRDGLQAVLGLVRGALPMRLRETAYLLGCEVAVADRKGMLEEAKLLAEIRRALELDPLVAVAMERATLARAQMA